jgi:hypothetical protein
MEAASRWIYEAFIRFIQENPNAQKSKKVRRSVFAWLPIVTRTLRNDYKEAIENAIASHGLEWVRLNLSTVLGIDVATFRSVNRHHVHGNLLDSRAESLMNANVGSHMGVESVMRSLQIEPLDDNEVLFQIGNCGEDGVEMLLENIHTIHFSEDFRKLIGVSPDPCKEFMLNLHGGDLFRESVFDIVKKYGFSVEDR